MLTQVMGLGEGLQVVYFEVVPAEEDTIGPVYTRVGGRGSAVRRKVRSVCAPVRCRLRAVTAYKLEGGDRVARYRQG